MTKRSHSKNVLLNFASQCKGLSEPALSACFIVFDNLQEVFWFFNSI